MSRYNIITITLLDHFDSYELIKQIKANFEIYVGENVYHEDLALYDLVQERNQYEYEHRTIIDEEVACNIRAGKFLFHISKLIKNTQTNVC